MMNKIKSKILKWDFKKVFARCIFVAVILTAAFGTAFGVLMRTQIKEAIALHQNKEQLKKEARERFFSGEESSEFFLDEWKEMKKNRRYDYEKFDHYKKNLHSKDKFWQGVQITPPSMAAMIALGIAETAFGILGIAYWLLVAAWLYQASHFSSMNTLLWTLAGLFWNLVAVIAFFVVRSFSRTRCEKCGTWQNNGDFCRKCGFATSQKCPHCESVLRLKDDFCFKCGKPIRTKA